MKNLMIISTVLLTSLSAFNEAKASSAVAYGVKSVHSVNDLNSREEATQRALETCSKRDTNCKVITKCEKEGFGAVAYEKVDDVITSVGAVCGINSFENSIDKALTKCKIHAKFDDCKVKSKWID